MSTLKYRYKWNYVSMDVGLTRGNGLFELFDIPNINTYLKEKERNKC